MSIVNFTLAFISQAAMVLFPALRSAGSGQEHGYYCLLRDGLSAILPLTLILYAPLRWLIGLWLPRYYESLFYLAFFFPVCLFEIQGNLTVATFLKVQCEPKALLGINVAAFLLACIAQIIAIYFFGSPIAVVLASLLGISTRYAIGTLYLGRVYGSQNGKMMTCLLAEMILFVASAYLLSLSQCFFVCVLILAAHIVIARPEVARLLSKVRKINDS